jgi:hypothetical protein
MAAGEAFAATFFAKVVSVTSGPKKRFKHPVFATVISRPPSKRPAHLQYGRTSEGFLVLPALTAQNV